MGALRYVVAVWLGGRGGYHCAGWVCAATRHMIYETYFILHYLSRFIAVACLCAYVTCSCVCLLVFACLNRKFVGGKTTNKRCLQKLILKTKQKTMKMFCLIPEDIRF